MVTQETLQALKSEIEALSADMAKAPYAPIVNLVHQGSDLLELLKNDMSAFIQIGINQDYVLKLEPAIEGLRDYQTVWKDSKKEEEEARKQWNILYPEGQALKKELLTTLRFVYSEDQATLAKISLITAGDGYDDLIQDLHEIAFLCKKDTSVFEPLQYDTSLFNRCEVLSSELMLLLGKLNGEKAEDNMLIINRNKAFYYLKDLIDYIRKYGKYAFRDNPSRAALYSESYYN